MKKIICFILLITMEMRASHIISLGSACTVAGAMRTYGIRFEAYPFDWLVSPFDSLYKALDDDFKNFLKEDSLVVRQSDKYGTLDYYGFHFVHDFPSVNPNDEIAALIGENHVTGGVLRDDWRQFIPSVKSKYLRRIERLRRVLNSREKVYLVRHCDTTRAQAVALRDLIIKKYPNLDFILVVVDRTQGIKQDWNLEKIKNFYLDDSVNGGQNGWEEIFRTLGFDSLV